MAKKRSKTRKKSAATVAFEKSSGLHCEAAFFHGGFRNICRDAKGKIRRISVQTTSKGKLLRSKAAGVGAGKGRIRFIKKTAQGTCLKKWRGLAVHRAKNGGCYVRLRG